MHWYQEALRKYADFAGRSRRKEYWMFLLMNLIISLVLGVVAGMIGFRWIGYLYTVFVFIPSIAVGVRRLHDTGRSGWWLLIGLIPIIGVLILIYFFILDSASGDNEYGPNPKSAVAA